MAKITIDIEIARRTSHNLAVIYSFLEQKQQEIGKESEFRCSKDDIEQHTALSYSQQTIVLRYLIEEGYLSAIRRDKNCYYYKLLKTII